MGTRALAAGPFIALALAVAPPGASAQVSAAAADTYTDAGDPARNFGRAQELKMDRSPQARAPLRFEVAGVEGPVDQALLAVFVKPDSSWTPLQVRSFPAEGWTETRLTYANAPDDGPLVDQVRVSGEGQWVLFDVTAEVRGNGSVGFTLASSSANSRWATSRETGRPPILAVSTDGRMLPEPPRGAMTHPLWTTTSVEEFDRELDLLAQAGADVVRLDIGWGALERDGPGDFQEWYVNRADTFIEHARARGLGVIATFWGVPCWASAAPSSVKQGCDGEWWRRGVDRYAPEDPDRFARAAAWVAERWGDELTALEVWNEPNIPYFLEGEQDRARTYSRILKPAYPRIKATKPGLRVLAGVMADSDGAFLNSLYRDHGIRGFHDGISYHPYTEGHDPDLPCSPGRPSVAQP